MIFFLAATGILLGSGLAALFAARSPRWATFFGAGGAVAGSLLGLIPAFQVLIGNSPESLRWAWSVPFGAFFIEIDPLSGFFLLPVFGLCALAAIYGSDYLQGFHEKKSLGPPWFFFNLLAACMAITVVARNGVLFLVAWEVMSLASFFLVTFEDEKESVREAGWTYLVATHLGTAFLLALFILLGRASGSLDFDRFGAGTALAPATANILFLLALIGFGTKAGLMPMHVWLPEAHPAAPSHVSAVMSGVMIKMGIYGIFRILTFLGSAPAWWGWLLIGVGLVSGVLGVLFALAQHDLKRLLAYHSVENIGIIVMGMGVGLLGLSHHSPLLVVLGFGGGLLHVLNHALFKGLLFLGAGSVLRRCGTCEIDLLGGLLKRMPWTGISFLIGSAAISGLPPLNGFVSEFLIYLGSFHGMISVGLPSLLFLIGVIAGLALIGGLASACFAKAFGIIFLGEPRSSYSGLVQEVGLAMRLPMLILAAGCIGIGLFSPALMPILGSVLLVATETSDPAILSSLSYASEILSFLVLGALLLLALMGSLAWLRRRLLLGRPVEEAGTWDCGYAQPTPRMQYTASSFAQPLTDFFKLFLRGREHFQPPQGLFPATAAFETETPDLFREKLFTPSFRRAAAGLAKLRWIQHGHLPLYILYIALTLMVLLVWRLGS